MPTKVAVIGGGVSGLTCAIVARLRGFDVKLFTLDLPGATPNKSPNRHQRSKFASMHAAASIIPHSVASPRAARWTEISQYYFRVLAYVARCAVREQTHFEVFEQQPASLPIYSGSVRDFAVISDHSRKVEQIPRRAAAKELFGWYFRALFCEAPEYLRFLLAFYRSIGGVTASGSEAAQLSKVKDYLDLGFRYYINCTGEAAIDFLDHGLDVDDKPDQSTFSSLRDSATPRYLRGHYLKVYIPSIVTDRYKRPFSYNYTPLANVYEGASGEAADVYCYPRSDCLLLGGSRQLYDGSLSPSEHWLGEDLPSDQMESFPDPSGNAMAIPKAIFSLNDELLTEFTNGEVQLQNLRTSRPELFVPGCGFRFQRVGDNDSVRVDVSRVSHIGEQYVFHNYGHGGSGFALSWGCALDVLSLLTHVDGSSLSAQISAGIPAKSQYCRIAELLDELTVSLLDGRVPCVGNLA